MWRSRNARENKPVVCIACGSSLPRSEAREYDKHGNRWERQGKSFEHLCKDCYRDLCHQPRDELESLLLDVETDLRAETGASADRPTFAATDTDERTERGAVDSAADSDEASDSQLAFLSKYFEVVESRYGSDSTTDRDD